MNKATAQTLIVLGLLAFIAWELHDGHSGWAIAGAFGIALVLM